MRFPCPIARRWPRRTRRGKERARLGEQTRHAPESQTASAATKFPRAVGLELSEHLSKGRLPFAAAQTDCPGSALSARINRRPVRSDQCRQRPSRSSKLADSPNWKSPFRGVWAPTSDVFEPARPFRRPINVLRRKSGCCHATRPRVAQTIEKCRLRLARFQSIQLFIFLAIGVVVAALRTPTVRARSSSGWPRETQACYKVRFGEGAMRELEIAASPSTPPFQLSLSLPPSAIRSPLDQLCFWHS